MNDECGQMSDLWPQSRDRVEYPGMHDLLSLRKEAGKQRSASQAALEAAQAVPARRIKKGLPFSGARGIMNLS